MYKVEACISVCAYRKLSVSLVDSFFVYLLMCCGFCLYFTNSLGFRALLCIM